MKAVMAGLGLTKKRNLAHFLLLIFMTVLSDAAPNQSLAGFLALIWWAVVVNWYFEPIGKWKNSKKSRAEEIFWKAQIMLLSDPKTRPTHRLDPEFGWMELVDDEEENRFEDEEYEKALERAFDNAKSLPELGSINDAGLMLAEMKKDKLTLDYASAHLLGDEAFIQRALDFTQGDWLLQVLEKHIPAYSKETILKLLEHTDSPYLLLRNVSEIIRNDRTVVLVAVTKSGFYLRHVSEEFNSDMQVVRAAVLQENNAFDFADPILLGNQELFDLARPQLTHFLSDSYPTVFSLPKKEEAGYFFHRLFTMMYDEGGLSINLADQGDRTGSFFGNGFVQARCLRVNVMNLDGSTYLKEEGAPSWQHEVKVEKIFRIYFKFITNGDFSDQPFIRVVFDATAGPSGLQMGNISNDRVYWYDQYSGSATPTEDTVFFARMCFDVVSGNGLAESLSV